MDYNQGISDEEFRGILSSLSGWYDRHGYLGMLKLLYRGLVTEPDKLYAATNVIEVFELLCTSGHLSATDLVVLYDTINITQPFGLEPEIRMFSMVTLLDIRTISITKFTRKRQILMKVVKSLSDNEVVKISQLCGCPQHCNRWELFVDLEQRSKICEENLDNFMRNLTTYLIIDSNEDPLGLRQTGKMDRSATRKANTRTFTDVPSNHHILFDEPSNKSVPADDRRELKEHGDEDVGTRGAGPEEIMVTGELDVGTRDAGPEELIVTGDVGVGTKEVGIGKLMETGNVDAGTRESGQKKLMETGDADVNGANGAGQGKLVETGDTDIGAKEAGREKLMETGDADVGAKGAGQEKLMETGNADVGAKETGQEKLMETGDADAGARVASPDNVHIFTHMVIEGNQGSVTGIQFSNCNIENVKIVNMTEVAGNQEASATYDVVIRKYLQERQQCLLRNAHLLTPPTWNSKFEIDLNHLFTDLVLLKNNRKEKEEPCTLQEFLDVVRTYDSCKILVEGDGGMGKTTLLKHIAHHSTVQQNDETFKEKIVFFINVRDIEQGEDIFDAILKQINLRDFNRNTKLKLKDKDEIQDFILNHDDEIVLLLDGYDELEASTEDPILSIFQKITLKQCKVILTSRSGKLAEVIKRCDVHVNVNGFSKASTLKFIRKFFTFYGKKSLAESLVKKIVHYSRKEEYDFYISEVCRTPMLLLRICIMWRENQCLPDNNTDLFNEIFKCILNQFTRNCDDEEKVSEFSDISSKFKNAMLVLGECIYRNLKWNKLSVAKKELKGSKDEIELALKLGFVYEDSESPISEHHFKKVYTTPHKLLSEALAGFYLCNAVQQGSFTNEEWEEMKCNEYLIHNTHVFAIGFLGKDAYKLLKHWITDKETSLYNLAKYFGHVQKDHKENVLKQLDEHLNNCYLEMRTFTNLSKSLRQFIVYCSSENKKIRCDFPPRQHVAKPEPIENEHFIKIIYEIISNQSIRYRMIIDWIQLVSCTEKKNLGRMVVHASVAFLNHFNLLEKIIELFPDTRVMEEILTECKKLRFVFNMTCLILLCKPVSANSSFLSLALHAPELSSVYLKDCNITGALLKDVVDGLYKRGEGRGVCMSLTKVSLNNNNLSDVSGHTLAQLFKLAPKLKTIHFAKCNLTGFIVERFLVECNKLNIDLKCCMVDFRYNNLSEMNVIKLLDGPLNVNGHVFKWSDYHLSSDNLQYVLQTCHECGNAFEFHTLDLSDTNLSVLEISVLSLICKVFPKSRNFNMNNCNISGSFVSALMNECQQNGIALKYDMVCLQGNDLSDMDSMSLANYLHTRKVFLWSSCHLSANNLHALTHQYLGNASIDIHELNFSKTNLSTISGKTLALIWKVFPKLKHVSMNGCNLSGMIVNDMLIECDRNGIDLKHVSIDLRDNKLSDIMSAINATSLAYLCNVKNSYRSQRVQCIYYETKDGYVEFPGGIERCGFFPQNVFKEYNLSVDEIQNLICAKFLKESGITDWQYYIKSVDKLQDLIKECNSCNIKLECTGVNLGGMDLSEANGAILSLLWKICPNLKHVNMSHCRLCGGTVSVLWKECERNDISLKNGMIRIIYNDISGIDVLTLRKLVNNGIISSANIWGSYGLTAHDLGELIQACHKDNITCDADKLNLHRTNLSTISLTTPALVWQIFPKCKFVDMSECTLSGRVIADLMNECKRIGIDFNINTICLKGNDLSDIDSESLINFIEVMKTISFYIGKSVSSFSWSEYKLTSYNLEELLNFCLQGGKTLELHKLKLTDVNLSASNGHILAYVSKVFPKLIDLDMSRCNLSSRIVGDLLSECNKNNLKGYMINLSQNDLSDIDSVSFALLLKIIHIKSSLLCSLKLSLSGIQDMLCANFLKISEITEWSDYVESVEKLEDLINECASCSIELECTKINLSGMNLSRVNVKTLALLWKICPKLHHIDMRNCCLSGRTVERILHTCKVSGFDLNGGKIRVTQNDLSDINSSMLAHLIRISSGDSKNLYNLKDYNLSIDAIQNPLCGELLKFSGITDFCDYIKSNDKLHDLIVEYGMCGIKLDCTEVNINLDDFSRETFALLWKICPKLRHISMNDCDVSGEIVRKYFYECDMNDIDLESILIEHRDNYFCGKGNTSLALLNSSIDFYHTLQENLSLVKSFDVFLEARGRTKWSDLALPAHKLHILIDDCLNSGIELGCCSISLSGLNLTEVDVSKLVLLWKICPYLSFVDMSNCNLSAAIVTKLLKECQDGGISLKYYMISFARNNLSGFDNLSFAHFIKTFHNQNIKLNQYHLSIDGIQDLISAQFFSICNVKDWNIYVKSVGKLHEVIDELVTCGIELEINEVNLEGMNLAEVDVARLALLWKICPKLNNFDMSNCNLSFRIVRDLLIECKNKGVNLKPGMICLCNKSQLDIAIYNVLKGIDASTLCTLMSLGALNTIPLDYQSCYQQNTSFCIWWCDYGLSADDLNNLLTSCYESSTAFSLDELFISDTDLSGISVAVLALLWHVFPKCHVHMYNCNLSGKFVGKLLTECDRTGVNLVSNMISLQGNDLSDMESTSLLHFIKINSMDGDMKCFFKLEDYGIPLDRVHDLLSAQFLKVSEVKNWCNYVKSADKLEDLLKECDSCGLELECTWVNLSYINLSEANGATLALLWKICPKLNYVNFNFCKLTGRIVSDLLKELKAIDVELKCNMLSLFPDFWSDIDATSLSQLAQVQCLDNISIKNIIDLTNVMCGSGNSLQCTEVKISMVDLATFSGEILFNFCKILPELKTLEMRYCRLRSNVVHDFLSLCVEKRVNLAITKLDLSQNDLHDFTGGTLSTLFSIFVQLKTLILEECEIRSMVVHNFVRLCLNCRVTLTELNMSNNELEDLNGKSLYALFSICPYLDCLKMKWCKIQSMAVHKFVSLCLKDNKVLPLTKLVLSHNDLYSLTAESLSALFSIFNRLDCFEIKDCSSSTLHGFVRSCIKDNNIFPLTKLSLGDYNLSSGFRHGISGKSLALIFSIFPNLKEIDLLSFHLHDHVLLGMADAIHCSISQLQKMYISISDDDTRARLKTVFPNCEFSCRSDNRE